MKAIRPKTRRGQGAVDGEAGLGLEERCERVECGKSLRGRRIGGLAIPCVARSHRGFVACCGRRGFWPSLSEGRGGEGAVRVWRWSLWSACREAANNREHQAEVIPVATNCVADCGCGCFPFADSAFRSACDAGRYRSTPFRGPVFGAIFFKLLWVEFGSLGVCRFRSCGTNQSWQRKPGTPKWTLARQIVRTLPLRPSAEVVFGLAACVAVF